ncbi:MAG TPA: hypothetical protein VFO83_09375 [Aggregicoccus sp.]|nr:hypothetical protein [Aggregicoccus sp.]
MSLRGAGLGLAALLTAAGCGSTGTPADAQPPETKAPVSAAPTLVAVPSGSAPDGVGLWALAEEGETADGGTEPAERSFSFTAGGPEQCRSLEQWQAYAVQTCQRFAATLEEAELMPGHDCGDGLARYVSFTCRGQLAPHAPQGGSVYAYPGIVGGADQCRPEADWAPLAAELCGPHQAAVQVVPERECGEGQTRYARVTCDMPLQNLPVPPECTLQSLANLCITPEYWPQVAAQHCAEKGQVVGEVAQAPGRTCGVGGYDFSWVTCCGPLAPPPPREECFGLAQGGPPSGCRSLATLEEQARQTCEDSGAKLERSFPTGPCGEDLFSYISMTCCR